MSTGDERRPGARQDGKAYLLGTFQGRLERRVSCLNIPGHILDHNNGVIYHKTGGNGRAP